MVTVVTGRRLFEEQEQILDEAFAWNLMVVGWPMSANDVVKYAERIANLDGEVVFNGMTSLAVETTKRLTSRVMVFHNPYGEQEEFGWRLM